MPVGEPGDLRSRAMRRRAVALGAVILLGLVGGAWWWTRPAAGWACQPDSPVECRTTANLFGLEGAPEPGQWRLAFNSFDMTPNQAAIAAGFFDQRDQPDEATDEARLVVNDVTLSGQPPPITTSPDGLPLIYVEGVAWSADGTRLAALVSDEASDHLVIVDRAGRYQGAVTTRRGNLSCAWQVGVSNDGSRVRCGRSWLDVATGQPADSPVDGAGAGAGGGEAPGDQLGRGVAIADDGTVARTDGNGVTLDPGGPVADTPTDGETVRLAFSPDTTTLTVLDRLPAAPAWRRPLRGRAQGRLTWVDVATRTVTASVILRDRPIDVDPDLADGWTAVLTVHGDVLLLRPS